MKKHDEGYVLPFVLIAVLVISLVIASVMTIPLRNLKSQQAVIERMQDRYQAEGAIEKFVALMTDESGLSSLEGDTETKAITKKIQSICNSIETGESLDKPEPKIPENTEIQKGTTDAEQRTAFAFSFEITSEFNTTKITSKMIFTGWVKEDEPDSKKYTITNPKITYETYEISTGGDAS